MKKIFLFFVCITLLSCEKEEESENYFNRQTGIEFSVINSNGEDLLNPEHPDKLAEEDIKLFYVIDGKKKEVFEAHLDYPRHFKIYKHKNEYRITVWPNDSNLEDEAITFIQWNETDTDTLGVTFERTSNSIIREKVWLNNVLVFDKNDDLNSDPFIYLTK